MRKENEKVTKFFNGLTEIYGFSVKSLAYGSIGIQHEKFNNKCGIKI